MRECKFKKLFCLQNIIFQNSQNFLRQILVRSKFFPQFVEKMEKLNLSLSKHLNKMLKRRSELLKTRKTSKTIKLGKTSQEFPESREFPRIPGKFCESFSLPGKLKIREKEKPYPAGYSSKVYAPTRPFQNIFLAVERRLMLVSISANFVQSFCSSHCYWKILQHHIK